MFQPFIIRCKTISFREGIQWSTMKLSPFCFRTWWVFTVSVELPEFLQWFSSSDWVPHGWNIVDHKCQFSCHELAWNLIISCIYIYTIHESNIGLENGWLEYKRFLLGKPIFRCELLVSGSVSHNFFPLEIPSLASWKLHGWSLQPAVLVYRRVSLARHTPLKINGWNLKIDQFEEENQLPSTSIFRFKMWISKMFPLHTSKKTRYQNLWFRKKITPPAPPTKKQQHGSYGISKWWFPKIRNFVFGMHF